VVLELTEPDGVTIPVGFTDKAWGAGHFRHFAQPFGAKRIPFHLGA
jgi:hypothetical protein